MNKNKQKIIKISCGKRTRNIRINPNRLIGYSGFDSAYFKRFLGIKAVEEALKKPIGTLSLEEICIGKKKIAILIDDNTRPTPTAKILPVVLRKLKNAGIKNNNISIIIAKGTHPELNKKALAKKISSLLVKKIKIIQHHSNNAEELVFVGKTDQGPVFMNKHAVNADLRIGIGQLSLSPFAGISSGAKLWLPGISSSETIRQNHKLAEDKSSDFGIIERNILRLDMEKAASLTGDNFYVGVILNHNKKIISAVAGDVIKAHRKGVEKLKKHITINIDDKADIVIVSLSPYDYDLYHSLHKMLAVRPFIKKKGELLCLSSCKNGIGSKDFFELMHQEVSNLEIKKKIEKNELMPDRGYIALRVKKFIRDFNVNLYTEKDLNFDIEKIGISRVHSIKDFINRNNKKVLVLPSIIILPNNIEVKNINKSRAMKC